MRMARKRAAKNPQIRNLKSPKMRPRHPSFLQKRLLRRPQQTPKDQRATDSSRATQYLANDQASPRCHCDSCYFSSLNTRLIDVERYF